MRLIDADAVYKILESCEIRKATIGNPLTDWEYGYTCGIERAESEIECAPTVDAQPEDKCGECDAWNQYKNYPRPTIDAVPVIRCKDCAWHKEKRCTVWRERAVIVECYTDDEGYCYLAKEKDDA